MKFKTESPKRKHVMKDATAITTTHEPPPTEAPGAKRVKLEGTEPEPLIILDKHGDLRLCVGAAHVDQPPTYLVCSKSLARSSPVIEQTIFGASTESRSQRDDQSDWVVHLPDDQPAPMQLMLEIIHGDFRRVRQEMELEALHTLVVLMDKYDALSLVRPWVNPWLDSVIASMDNAIMDNARLLSAAWILGDMYLFRESTFQLIYLSNINCAGDLINNFGSKRGNPASPSATLVDTTASSVPGIMITQMAAKRARWASGGIAPYLELYEQLKKSGCKCTFASGSPDSNKASRCRALAIGSLVQGFLDMGINLTTRDPALAYTGSIASLIKQVDKLEILFEQTSWASNHTECANMRKTAVDSIASNVLSTIKAVCRIEPEYQAHIESQAEKTGLLG